MRRLLLLLFCSFLTSIAVAQQGSEIRPADTKHQIYLTKPAIEIIQLLHFKDCSPINGELSEKRDKIIMEDYEPGKKVYIQVIYEDGTYEEFIRNPCFIDPVIL